MVKIRIKIFATKGISKGTLASYPQIIEIVNFTVLGGKVGSMISTKVGICTRHETRYTGILEHKHRWVIFGFGNHWHFANKHTLKDNQPMGDHNPRKS